MVGDSAEIDCRILKSDSKITKFRVTLFLPGDYETPQPKQGNRSKLNNVIMKRSNLLLCNLTQQSLESTPSSHVKHPVWNQFSDRTLIMRLEPANEKTYMNIALIFGVIFCGALVLLILYHLRSWLMRICWHEAQQGSEHAEVYRRDPGIFLRHGHT